MIASYTKYDHLFSHVLPNAVGDVKIFSKEDDYLIEQNYEAVTEEDIRRVSKKLLNTNRLMTVVVGRMADIQIPN